MSDVAAPWIDTGPLPERVQAIVVGAGPAGLAAARALRRCGTDALVLEAGSSIGGRTRSHRIDGWTMAHGFQVLNTGYPEVQRQLDLDSLDLRPFDSGVVVRARTGKLTPLHDPIRHPRRTLQTLASPIGSAADKVRLAQLALQARGTEPHSVDGDATTSAQRIADARIGALGSDVLAPFFAGVFLETGMETASRKLDWLLHVFGAGAASLPARGMGAVSEQLAAGTPAHPGALRVRVDSRVESMRRGDDGRWNITLVGGATVIADGCIVAAEERSARGLLPDLERSWTTADDAPARIATTLYFEAQRPPHTAPLVCVNGTGHGLVNNSCVLSNVAPEHAPSGRALIQATVVGEVELRGSALAHAVQDELVEWFGAPVAGWTHLDTIRVDDALPFFAPAAYGIEQDVLVGDRLAICGDHVDGATLDGALRSGRRAGEQLAAALR